MTYSWFIPCMFAVGLWGFSMFLPKLALRTLAPLPMIVYFSGFFLLWAILMQALYGFHIEFNATGTLVALGVGVTGTVAQLLYLIAINRGAMAYGMVITSLYPAVSTLLAFLTLGEKLSFRQGCGLLLGIASLILMVIASDDKAHE
jgi:transporter family protein